MVTPALAHGPPSAIKPPKKKDSPKKECGKKESKQDKSSTRPNTDMKAKVKGAIIVAEKTNQNVAT